MYIALIYLVKILDVVVDVVGSAFFQACMFFEFKLRYNVGRKAFKWLYEKVDSVEQTLLNATKKMRFALTKTVKITSPHVHQPKMFWEDLYLYDQWGMDLCSSLTLSSKGFLDFNNKIADECQQPPQPFQDVIVSDDGYREYLYREEHLSYLHFIAAARTHLEHSFGRSAREKCLTLELSFSSVADEEHQKIQEAEWIANGSKPFKMFMTERAEEDFTDLFGADAAEQLKKDVDEHNKNIDDK